MNCKHCKRRIVQEDGRWVDPEATGDDSVWRETCDAHDTFTAEHEPDTIDQTRNAPSFNRDAARTVDNYVADSNRLDAIAEATKLPRLFSGGVSPHASPQGSATSWALWVAREHRFDIDATIVLVALAQHAAASTFSGDGYLYTTAAEIAAMLPFRAIGVIAREMEPRGHIWPHVEEHMSAGGEVLGWRIPNEALDGKWLDRAARRTHYGKASTTEGGDRS
jgi:hypothetical protein